MLVPSNGISEDEARRIKKDALDKVPPTRHAPPPPPLPPLWAPSHAPYLPPRPALILPLHPNAPVYHLCRAPAAPSFLAAPTTRAVLCIILPSPPRVPGRPFDHGNQEERRKQVEELLDPNNMLLEVRTPSRRHSPAAAPTAHSYPPLIAVCSLALCALCVCISSSSLFPHLPLLALQMCRCGATAGAGHCTWLPRYVISI